MNEYNVNKGSFSERLKNPEFVKLLEREEFVESFLVMVDEEMESQRINQRQLADRLGYSPANLSRILCRERNMTVETMVDVAFHLGLRIRLSSQRVQDYVALWTNPSQDYLRADSSKLNNVVQYTNYLKVAPRFSQHNPDGSLKRECTPEFSGSGNVHFDHRLPKSYCSDCQDDSDAAQRLSA